MISALHCSAVTGPSAAIFGPHYDTAAALIESRYRDVYAADMRCQHDELLVCTDSQGQQVLAAAGIRRPDRLFYLENYLPSSAEACVSKLRQRQVQRRYLVEVGNFVAFQGRAALVLMHSLFRYLVQADFRHILMTCTRQLKRSFKGMPTQVLAPARQHRVEDGKIWGSYYQQNPEVITGELGAYDQRFSRFTQRHDLRCYYVNQSGEQHAL